MLRVEIDRSVKGVVYQVVVAVRINETLPPVCDKHHEALGLAFTFTRVMPRTT
jgi:hypothetical protein